MPKKREEVSDTGLTRDELLNLASFALGQGRACLRTVGQYGDEARDEGEMWLSQVASYIEQIKTGK